MQITEIPTENDIQETKRSILSTVALVCSLIFCCPIATIFGPILGIIALIRIRVNPKLKGKRIAWAGIIIGVITTVISVVALFYVGELIVTMLTKSTQTTLQAGFDKDYVTFRKGLTSENYSISDEDIEVFITELRKRYGIFDSVVFNREPDDQQLVKTRGEEVLPMRFVFEETVVNAEVLVQVLPGEDGGLIKTLIHCILIFDSTNGDIVFPTGSDCATSSGSDVNEEEVGGAVDEEPVP